MATRILTMREFPLLVLLLYTLTHAFWSFNPNELSTERLKNLISKVHFTDSFQFRSCECNIFLLFNVALVIWEELATVLFGPTKEMCNKAIINNFCKFFLLGT